MKKILSVIISLAIIVGVGLPSGTVLASKGREEDFIPALPAYEDYFIPIIVDGSGVTQRDCKISTVSQDGEILVDVSALEGADIDVALSDGSAVITSENADVTLVADSDLALTDSGRENLGADVLQEDGTLYAPLDDLAELCGIEEAAQDGATVYYKPFQTLRLIVSANGRLPETGAVDKYKDSFGNTVLIYSSQEDTKAAYNLLSYCNKVDSVEWENVYYTCDIDDYETEPEHLSWGSDYIGSSYVVNYAQSLEDNDRITVAIVDTGVDIDHPFLVDRLSSYTKPNVDDVVGHGTHCAGIVADNTPDNVEILPVKGLTSKSGSGTDSSLAEAINYAVSCNADIISMSFGSADVGGHSVLKEAVKRAYDAGCILVAAAGNESTDASKRYPANSPYCIAVGATDRDGKPANFSNYGNTVAVSAPGVSINSCYLDGGYKVASGTSMAAPFVAAACATDFTINGKRNFDYEKSAIVNSTTPFSQYNSSSRIRYGAGIISYYGYLDRPMVSPVSFSVRSGSFDKLFDVSLSCQTPGAQIYYLQSSDESIEAAIPTPDNATLYTEPIVISGNTTLVAAAYCNGMLRSERTVETYVFNDYDFDENYIVDENGCLTGYTGSLEILSVPEYLNGVQITSVGEGCFENSNIVSINLPDSVTELKEAAFKNCKSLEHITAKGVTQIPDYCFYWNLKLSSLKLGTLVSIGNSGFNHCPKINENTLDLSSVEYIGDYGLYMTSFTTLELYNIKYFGEYSFGSCNGLESISLPNVKVIQSRAFRDCNSLKSVSLESCLQLDDAVFAFCKSLTNVEAEKLQVLGDGVFDGCKSLVSINLPNVEQIGAWCFTDTGFETINLPKVTQTGTQAFSRCVNLKNVNMPAQEYIPAQMFIGCTSLEEIPACFTNAVEVGLNAFKDCSALKSVSLPNARVINKDAFIGATALEEISLPNAVTVYWQQLDAPTVTSLDLPKAEVINSIVSDYIQSISAPSAWVIGSTKDCKALTELNAPSLIANIDNPFADMDTTPEGKAVIKTENVTVSSCTYNPFEERTVPSYSVIFNGTELEEGTDYTITFANNIANGTAYYKVEGIGNYAGIVTGSFKINNYSIKNLNVQPIESELYNGLLHLPAVTLTDENGNVLTKGYSVKYSDNLNAGRAAVTVTGLSRNGYTTDISSVIGTVSADFNIVAKSSDVDAFLESTDYPYMGSQICPKPVVILNDYTFEEGKDYTLRYATNTELGRGTVFITFISEYCTGSKALDFNIVPAQLDASLLGLNATEFSYTGSEIKPNVVSSRYKLGTDYTVFYDNNIKKGTATVIVTGIGNYTGTVKLTFKIYYSNRWAKVDGVWYYYNSVGRLTVGWLKIGSYWYYFDNSGAMQTGRQLIGKTYYYFNSSGAMQTGWQMHDGYWYYYSSSGAMQTGWIKSGGKWYYMNQFGVMQRGWQKIGSVWYYFVNSGAMQTGWLKLSGYWYYFESSGAMHTGWLKSGGKWYYFNASGVMVTGKQKIDGKRYTFNSSGALT